MGAEGFLVGNRGQDQGATGRKSLRASRANATAIEAGLMFKCRRRPCPKPHRDELAAKRVAAPGVRVHRHDIGVAE